MPIDTDVETRMKCFGKFSKTNSIICAAHCCFIEKDLCDEKEKDGKKEVIKLK